MKFKLVNRRQAWEEFISSGSITEDVDEIIVRSWQRSLKAGIDITKVQEIGLLTGYELKQRIEKAEELLWIAVPEMTKLYHYLRGNNVNIMLVDGDGFILKSMGYSGILPDTTRVKLIEGANWKEDFRGTNAIGTALVEKKPVKVHASEHFTEEIQFLSCFAAPITSLIGELAGVINVTVFSKEAHPYAMGMVLSTARAIENKLLYRSSLENIASLTNKFRLVSEKAPEGLLAIDRKGNIALINAAAARLLRCDPKEFLGGKLDVLMDGAEAESVLQKIIAGKENWVGVCNGRMIKWGVLSLNKDEILLSVELEEGMIKVKGEGSFFSRIIGNSDSLNRTKIAAIQASKTDSTVLLEGETGTGKELFARGIHEQSSDGPFVAVNCGAIPRDLLESELFGYEEGAFTGARRGGVAGKFEQANGGTIFLDEIGEMPVNAQVALLRVLEEREVVRVGGHKPIPLELRVIAATNRDLKQAAEIGEFREDLYYRLNVVSIRIPPLRERGDDVIVLAQHFLDQLCQRWNWPPVEMAARTQELLLDYSYPGNVRELRSIMERALTMSQGDPILPKHLLDEIRYHNTRIPTSQDKEAPKKTRRKTLREIELQRIKQIVQECNGNISRAAEILGVSRNTVYRKLRQLEELHD